MQIDQTMQNVLKICGPSGVGDELDWVRLESKPMAPSPTIYEASYLLYLPTLYFQSMRIKNF